MATTDPARRMVRCPSCGRLESLDADGRFLPHVPGGDAAAIRRGWCAMAGREPGKVSVANPPGKERGA